MGHARPFFTTLLLAASVQFSLQSGCVNPQEVEQLDTHGASENDAPEPAPLQQANEESKQNPFLRADAKQATSDPMDEACTLNLRAERLYHVPLADDFPKDESDNPTQDWREFDRRPDYAWDLLGGQDDIEQILHETALKVCKTLYRSPFEVRIDSNRPLVLSFQPNRGAPAWAITRDNEYRIVISTLVKHIGNHSPDRYIDELKGIIAHELTHIYQYNDDDGNRDADQFLHGDEKLIDKAQRSRMIEGMADYVRTQTGWVRHFSQANKNSELGEWGEPFVEYDHEAEEYKVKFNGPTYQGLGWFFTWLEHKLPGIAYRLNQSMDSFDGEPWTFERFRSAELAGDSVKSLWNKYRDWANLPSCSNACGGDYFCESLVAEKCGENDLGMRRCVEKPGSCIQSIQPVCGCDGKTYSNACVAAQAGVSLRAHVSCEAVAEGLRPPGS